MQQSVRKHYSQMNKDESLFLFQEALKVHNWELDGHIKKKMNERGMIHKEEVVDILRFGELIEFHLRNGKSRILVRGSRTYYNFVPCAVFELKTGKIITLYWNKEDDNHRTIDMSRYNAELDVLDTYRKSE